MSKVAVKSQDTQQEEGEFKCSCGRTFAHELSMKRHHWMTGHAPAAPGENPAASTPAPASTSAPAPSSPASAPTAAAAPSALNQAPQTGPLLTPVAMAPVFSAEPYQGEAFDDPYHTALETLMAKVQEQEAFERHQQRLLLLQEFTLWMAAGSRDVADEVLALGGCLTRSGLWALGLLGRSLMVTVVMMAALMGGLSMGRALAVRSQAAEPVSHVATHRPRQLGGAHLEKPSEVVQNFYEALNERDFSAAYGELSAGWQRELSLRDLEDSYRTTESVTCLVTGVRKVSDRQVRVEFRLHTVDQGEGQDHVGSYLLVKVASGWQIDRGQLN